MTYIHFKKIAHFCESLGKLFFQHDYINVSPTRLG